MLRKAHSGQAMIETVLAVLVISFVFFVLFRLSQMLSGKIMLEHAAMRVARARAVGMNEFMCVKTARVAVIPVAGKRLWPEGDELDAVTELARVPIYLGTPNGGVANGVLDYEGWSRLKVNPGTGANTKTAMAFGLFDESESFRLEGKAGLEHNYMLYMDDQGR